MQKKIAGVIICLVVCLTAVAGYVYGKNRNSEDLPVYENTTLYPEFSFPELSEKASCIVNANVIAVGETILKEIPVSLTENPDEATEVLYSPITPITLEVLADLKGDNSKTITYYEDGGITPSYIQLPSGYAMEEGMEVIIFLNAKGYGWGAQSIFPVLDDSVILNKAALDYIDSEKVSTIKTEDIQSNLRSQIKSQTISVISKEDFINVINSMTGEELK